MSYSEMNVTELLKHFVLVFTNNGQAYKKWTEQYDAGYLVSRFYTVIDWCDYSCRDNDLILISRAIKNKPGTPKASMLAELLEYYGDDMARANIRVEAGQCRTRCVIDMVNWYNVLKQQYTAPRVTATEIKGNSADVIIKDDLVEETTMSTTTIEALRDTAVTMVPVVFGLVITPETKDDTFISVIRDLKKKIDALDDLLDSERMNAKRAELIKQRDNIVKLFDSRV